ncbi:MAG: UbiA family prenyltransferase [Candidatus Thermoplasmatota archaeon]
MSVDCFNKEKIGGFLHLIRPFTLLAPVIVSSCIMFASFFYNNIGGDIVLTLFYVVLPASISLALINGASNALNQVADVESDRISKPYRPLVKGVISKKSALMVSAVMYSSAVFISFFIDFLFAFFVGMIIFFTITYSVPPRCKSRLFLNQIWIAVPRGLFGVLASWSIFGNPFNHIPLTIGLVAMFFLFGGSITKDIHDCDADKKTGVDTLINTYGVKESAFIVMPFMFTPFVMLLLLVKTGAVESYLWPLTLFVVPSIFICYLMIKRDVKKVGSLENNCSWAAMYITYFFFAFSFSFLTIFNSTVFI